LRHQREVARLCRALAEGGVEPDGRALDAKAVGADETDAVFFRHRFQRILERGTRRARLAEAGRQHNGVTDAALPAFFHDLRDGRRRRRNQRQLRNRRQFAGAGVAAFAVDRLVLRVDRIDLALIARMTQVPEQGAGDRVLALAGAEDRDRTGVEQGAQIVLRHGFAESGFV
jgi:hypothetical protein